MTSLHDRIEALEKRVSQLTSAIETHIGRPALAEEIKRPTLEQALGMAEQAGVTAGDAEAWWLARESTSWVRGTMGGGLLSIGSNHAADLKTFTNATRQSFAQKQPQNGFANAHDKPKAETVWSLKQSLDAVNDQIEECESHRSAGAWGNLPAAKKVEKGRLEERRRELKKKLAGLE